MDNLLKIFRYKRVFYLYILFGPLLAMAQNQAEKGLPFITNFQSKEYQAHPQNWAIAEDDNGVMYFGNSVCLLEYDGVKWRRLYTSNNTTVRSLTKDKNGRIYFGGYGDFGYLAPDSLGLNQERSLLKYVPEAYRNFNDVWTISATNEGIYFQSRERIFRLKQKSGAPKEKWEVKVWESPNKYMFAFYLDGTYYVHQQGVGLLKMVGDSLTLVPGSEFIGKERMQVMLPYTSTDEINKNSASKKYLVGLFYTGLYIYDGKTFTHFKSEADTIFKSSLLYKGAQLSDGSYALSTAGKGLVEIDAKGKIIQHIKRDVGLQDETVYAVYTARNGSLWLGLDNGISRVETASAFTQFAIQSGITNSVLTAARFEGALYLGTTNGILEFNSSNAKFEVIKNGLLTNQIFNFLQDSDKLLIPADGFYYLKDKTTHLIRASVSGDLQMQSVYILKKTPGVLLAAIAGGLVIFSKNTLNKSTGTITTANEWSYVGKVDVITDNIWSFAEQSDGKVWLGTSNGGALKLSNIVDQYGLPDLKNIKIERFGTEHGLTKGNIHVFSIPGKNCLYQTPQCSITMHSRINLLAIVFLEQWVLEMTPMNTIWRLTNGEEYGSTLEKKLLWQFRSLMENTRLKKLHFFLLPTG